ncbi:hypothetical protein BUALT_Bualt17G0062700 [Buddleja alternifolia]|uniref:WRKY domain-containing protein n=1 Tax=Buddleja alternifolia TaxID=168488 RepID=A0AAV6WCV7_9LAMI|nr:hypothetical protein BUALT_Bualt17G0062700 [Buddleja alternifolia]
MQEDNLKTAKVKIDEVREENKRLKSTLFQMMKDCRSLKMQIHDIFKEDQPKKSTDSAPTAASNDESELVSLSLGKFSGDSKKNSYESKIQENDRVLDGLELGLDCKFHLNNPTLENSFDESNDEQNDEKRAYDKRPKTSRRGEDEMLQQNPSKKPRVSVRALCNTQTMNDGCQWRKYGQKISKGNPCPRGYYCCTVSSSCPVRKQVQRCADDMSILITTYEGTHNHPLPPSATTMASATSAAVAMLNCGSSTSAAASPNLLGFNFTSSNNLTNPYFPNISISTSQSHPTITLDLTTNHTSPYNKFSSSTLFPSTHFSSKSLNFSSSNSSFDQPKFHCISNLESPYSKPFVFNNIIQASQEKTANDKIADATKAITFDPTFRSALAAAITSFVGTNDQGRNLGMNFVKRDENLHLSYSQHEKRLMHFPPFAFSTSKSPLANKGEQVNL